MRKIALIACAFAVGCTPERPKTYLEGACAEACIFQGADAIYSTRTLPGRVTATTTRVCTCVPWDERSAFEVVPKVWSEQARQGSQ